jgi:hypothetical protein
MEPPNSKKGA